MNGIPSDCVAINERRLPIGDAGPSLDVASLLPDRPRWRPRQDSFVPLLPQVRERLLGTETVAAIAADLRMDPSTLALQFQKATGQTVTQYRAAHGVRIAKTSTAWLRSVKRDATRKLRRASA